MYTGMCSLYLVKSASIVMYGVLRKGNVYVVIYTCIPIPKSCTTYSGSTF